MKIIFWTFFWFEMLAGQLPNLVQGQPLFRDISLLMPQCTHTNNGSAENIQEFVCWESHRLGTTLVLKFYRSFWVLGSLTLVLAPQAFNHCGYHKCTNPKESMAISTDRSQENPRQLFFVNSISLGDNNQLDATRQRIPNKPPNTSPQWLKRNIRHWTARIKAQMEWGWRTINIKKI